MELRELNKSDYQQLLDLYNYYIENTAFTLEYDKLSLADFSKRIDKISENYPFIVAVEHEKIAGYAYLNAFSERKGYMHTVDLSIYVHKDELRKGYGKMLAEEIINLAKERGYKNIISIVTAKNEQSIAFHKSIGFFTVGEFMGVAEKFGETFGVTYMQLKLTEE